MTIRQEIEQQAATVDEARARLRAEIDKLKKLIAVVKLDRERSLVGGDQGRTGDGR